MSTDMNPKWPELRDFDVTPEQYAFYIRMGNKDGPSIQVGIIASAITVLIVVSVLLVTTGDKVITGWSAFGSLFVVAPVASFLIDALIIRYNRWRLLKGPIVSRIKLYEEAEATYRVAQWEALGARQEAERQRREAERARQADLLAQQRKREQYWESLGGIEFERELGKLYRARGYQVEFTPISGDQGVDLILRKNGKTTVIQCKAQKRPANPNVIRDLYGSMLHHKADNAILACTGGFSGNVVKFARGKPIRLISAWDIARMAEESGDGMHDMAESTPICPTLGCGEKMVLRNGRRGRFWGYPGYPTCRGSRNL